MRSFPLFAVSLAAAALGCGSGVDLACGPGTVESDGQCLPSASPSTGGSGGSTDTGGSGGTTATGGSDTGGSAGSATGGAAGEAGSGGATATGGSGGDTGCVPQDGGYLVTLTVALAANQLPAVVKDDLPGYGWDQNAVTCDASPCVAKVVSTSGLHRFNAALPNGDWLVRGDIELGFLSVPISDLQVRVNCSDLQPIKRLEAGQTTIPPFSVWYGRERDSGDGQAFLCLSTADCAIDAR